MTSIVDKTMEEETCMLHEKSSGKIIITSASSASSASETNSSKKGILAQCLLTGAIMLTSASCGMPIGYSAILLPQLQASNSSMHIDENMGSWIASIHSAATPLGSFVSGILMEKCGRRITLQLSVLPIILGWIIIASAGNHAWLLVGRIIAGTSVGLTAAPGQVMIAEISEPYVRGIFGSVPFASYAFGILLVYALGSILHWRVVAGLSIILPVIALTSFFFLPDSPVWLLRHGHKDKAMKALIWLRGGDVLQAKRETEQLMTRIRNENNLQSQQISQSTWRLLTKAQMLKPFIIINVFNLLQVVSGTYIVVFYAVDILSQIGENFGDSFFAAVLTSGVRFVFTIIACIILAVVGRRPLALGSGIGTALSALALGTFLYSNSNDSTYIPAILLLIYVATNTIGIMILPGVMIGEIYPANLRGLAGGITFMIFNIIVFATTKIFPLIKNSLGIHGVFWLFGGCSLIASLFFYLVLPETKGRTLSQIEDYFLEKNTLWITRDKEWERKNLKDNQTV